MLKTVPVKIKLFDSTLPLPTYHSKLAAGFDLYARLDMTIDPGEIKIVPGNIALEIPPDYWILLTARSSLQKRGLQLANGIGVFDADYCGDDDEVGLILRNFSAQTVTIKKGERLAQAILIPRLKAQFTLVAKLENQNRGGIGSTGK
jgi:dUTP pyrophosphatase